MILGPSEWRDLGAVSSMRFLGTPLRIRHELAEYMRRTCGVRVVLMEEHERRPGENHFALFKRLIIEENVTTFMVVWPLGARLHGLTLELGYLFERLLERDLNPDCVEVLVERGLLRISDNGSNETVFALEEPGNRTRYYSDLLDLECVIRPWKGPHPLLFASMAASLSHSDRHALFIEELARAEAGEESVP